MPFEEMLWELRSNYRDLLWIKKKKKSSTHIFTHCKISLSSQVFLYHVPSFLLPCPIKFSHVFNLNSYFGRKEGILLLFCLLIENCAFFFFWREWSCEPANALAGELAFPAKWVSSEGNIHLFEWIWVDNTIKRYGESFNGTAAKKTEVGPGVTWQASGCFLVYKISAS